MPSSLRMTRPRNNTEVYNKLTIWQWNSRSLTNKKQNLLHYSQLHDPDVIAIQEAETDHICLRGYNTYFTTGKCRTVILVKKHHTTVQHHFSSSLEYTFIELLPKTKSQASLFILNIYSPPQASLAPLSHLIQQNNKLGGKNSSS